MEINKISEYQCHSEQSISSGHFQGRNMTLSEPPNLSKLNHLEALACITNMTLQQEQHLERLVQGTHSSLATCHIEVL